MPPPSIALDLGTANTRIYTSEFGKITEEPSWVRYIAENKEQPVSDEYIAYINSRLVSTPLRGGVIVDIKSAITLLKPLVKQTRKWLMPPTTEIGESGICLTGGGACISGIDSLIASKTQLPVKIASDPLHSVIHGAGQALNCWKNKECWWENVVWPKLAA